MIDWLNKCGFYNRYNDAQKILQWIFHDVFSIKIVYIFMFFSMFVTSPAPAQAIEIHIT